MGAPDLYTTLTRDAAIAAFRGWRRPKSYCNDQFVVCGDAILFFGTVTGAGRGVRLVAPDLIEWWPNDPEEYANEKVRWFPEAVRPKYDTARKRWRRRCHLLLGQGADWLYCGPMDLTSYQYAGAGRFDDASHVTYKLATRLPYAQWVSFGGYDAWQIKVGANLRRLGLSDTAGLAQALDDLPAEAGHIELTRWQGDLFSVFFNATCAFPMYQRDPGDPGLYVAGAASDRMEPFSCPCCGIDLSFPRSMTVPHADALDLLRRYFAEGIAPAEGAAWLTDRPWRADG